MSDLYAQRGVSAQKEDVHFAIKGLDHGLFPNTFCKILPDTLTGSADHACIMHADTAGTKSILAYLYWKETGDLSVWKGIAQDAIVMNIDDMICSGAVDRFVLSSTIARNKNRISRFAYRHGRWRNRRCGRFGANHRCGLYRLRPLSQKRCNTS
jgi:phosphoribosylformylglycinamidine cyclo-ligase